MTPLEIVGTVSASATAITAAAGAVALFVRGERRARRVTTRLFGDAATPTALDRLDRLEVGVTAIQAQLSPNHGGSLHDVVVRVDERTRWLAEELTAHLAAPHPRR